MRGLRDDEPWAATVHLYLPRMGYIRGDAFRVYVHPKRPPCAARLAHTLAALGLFPLDGDGARLARWCADVNPAVKVGGEVFGARWIGAVYTYCGSAVGGVRTIVAPLTVGEVRQLDALFTLGGDAAITAWCAARYPELYGRV